MESPNYVPPEVTNHVLRIPSGALRNGVTVEMLQKALEIDLIKRNIRDKTVTLVIDDTIPGKINFDDEMFRRDRQMERLRILGTSGATRRYVDETTRMPNPERKAAAEAKRARKNAARARNELATRIGRE